MTHAATSLLSSPPLFENTTPASTPVRSLWLEVRRGRTRTPRRPIRSRRFLIGAGSNCQLQLGGEGIPLLHSILLVDEDGIHIYAVVPAPELVVNGVPQQSAPLRDGDSIRIGLFEFALRVEEAAALAPLPVPGQGDEPAAAEVDDLLNLSRLSAAELVERIEHEHHRLEQFEAARRAGPARCCRRRGGRPAARPLTGAATPTTCSRRSCSATCTNFPASLIAAHGTLPNAKRSTPHGRPTC